MSDITLSSLPEQLHVTLDLDTGDAGLWCFYEYQFKVSSSQLSAMWKLWRNTSGLDGNPLTLGVGGPTDSKLKVIYDESTTTAHLYLGPITREQLVFRLTSGQWAVLRDAHAVWLA